MQKLLDDHAAERAPKVDRMALAGTIAAVDDPDPDAESEPEAAGLIQLELRPKPKRV